MDFNCSGSTQEILRSAQKIIFGRFWILLVIVHVLICKGRNRQMTNMIPGLL